MPTADSTLEPTLVGAILVSPRLWRDCLDARKRVERDMTIELALFELLQWRPLTCIFIQRLPKRTKDRHNFLIRQQVEVGFPMTDHAYSTFRYLCPATKLGA